MGNIRRLFEKFDNCPLCKSSGNQLQHILGGGKIRNPKVAFVFINPTYTNISSGPKYKGPRFPFIGVTHFWRVFNSSGWISDKMVEQVKGEGWTNRIINNLERELRQKGIYITNLVKCSFPHSSYPKKRYFDYHFPLFKKEIEIVNPKGIISFGTFTTKQLTGKSLVFKEFLKKPKPLSYLDIPVFPCYFPVGRGNPKLATAVLRRLKYLIE